jgi:hypothetical protein
MKVIGLALALFLSISLVEAQPVIDTAFKVSSVSSLRPGIGETQWLSRSVSGPTARSPT